MKHSYYKLENGSDSSSTMEEKFERYIEGIAAKFIRSGKQKIDRGFIHIRIEE